MKKGLSIEDHKKYGEMLKKMYIDSMDIYIAFCNSHPHSRRVCKQLDKLHNAIIQVKSEAENELFRYHPSLGHEGVYFYYGAVRKDNDNNEA